MTMMITESQKKGEESVLKYTLRVRPSGNSYSLQHLRKRDVERLELEDEEVMVEIFLIPKEVEESTETE